MGACNFYVRATGSNAEAAFMAAQAEARYEYGHGGYTGTIAEKDGYTIFPVPKGFTAVEVSDALLRGDDAKRAEMGGSRWAETIISCWDDKWGPAVALHDKDANEWLFCGMASE